jgi:hypothetical protein
MNIKEIIKTKLAVVDIENKYSKGAIRNNRLNHELTGIKLALECFNMTLTLSINPYYFENFEPSTFEIEVN